MPPVAGRENVRSLDMSGTGDSRTSRPSWDLFAAGPAIGRHASESHCFQGIRICLIGAWKQQVPAEVELSEFANMARRISFHATSKAFAESDAIGEVAICPVLRERFLTFLRANPVDAGSRVASDQRCRRSHAPARLRSEEKFAKFIISWRAKLGRGGALSNSPPTW